MTVLFFGWTQKRKKWLKFELIELNSHERPNKSFQRPHCLIEKYNTGIILDPPTRQVPNNANDQSTSVY